MWREEGEKEEEGGRGIGRKEEGKEEVESSSAGPLPAHSLSMDVLRNVWLVLCLCCSTIVSRNVASNCLMLHRRRGSEM